MHVEMLITNDCQCERKFKCKNINSHYDLEPKKY